MNPNLIDAALEQHLLTLPGAPSIAWEDVAFKPVTGQAYLQVNHLRNNPIDRAITLDGREDRGILQVTVVHPAGRGRAAANALAHKVASHFPAGTRLTLGNRQAITVYKSPAIATGYPDEGWYRIPVSISWSAG